MKTAMILMAHGSRSVEANDDLRWLADRIRERGEHDQVVAAFLELAEPSIPDASRAAVGLGAEHVVLMPVFLSAGVHVQRDLTKFRDDLRVEFPTVAFDLMPPIGRHPMLIDIILDRAVETQKQLEPQRHRGTENTCGG